MDNLARSIFVIVTYDKRIQLRANTSNTYPLLHTSTILFVPLKFDSCKVDVPPRHRAGLCPQRHHGMIMIISSIKSIEIIKSHNHHHKTKNERKTSLTLYNTHVFLYTKAASVVFTPKPHFQVSLPYTGGGPSYSIPSVLSSYIFRIFHLLKGTRQKGVTTSCYVLGRSSTKEADGCYWRRLSVRIIFMVQEQPRQHQQLLLHLVRRTISRLGVCVA